MNGSEAARFRERVARRIGQRDGEDSLGHEGQGVVTPDPQSVGRALQSKAMAKAGRARRNAERRLLAGALARIDEGESEHREVGGAAIPVRRPELDPAATRGVACASG